MKKTTKKLDNSVIKALTIACETAKQWDSGFLWLTHSANYQHFPASLRVTCVFGQESEIQEAYAQGMDNDLRRIIHSELLRIGVQVKDNNRLVRFDSEERCLMEDQGNWNRRLAR
ncbi:Fis family transcriptional regulator [Alteromonas ponticola]|uniref:Fis family transcriptional regulator n=1 Tax=Alteromonas aquimaris TaxID=2998417 RepID=A0ABT3P8X2_9ALTE|nr:Fis family transcriptional regulator [Alteromonas aquimaris]MCW8109199.1 Fis family transcriptional regulator [Alteromonas aquimaris]